MEMKQDMTNIYSWFRWMHKEQLLLGQPQLIQTLLRRGTAKGIFHVLSHPQGLFFRAEKCFLLSYKPPPTYLQLSNQLYWDSAELGIGNPVRSHYNLCYQNSVILYVNLANTPFMFK